MRRRISGGAVKESFDNLPMGLCFSLENGVPILVNRVMYGLCHAIAGESPRNAELFWQLLTEGEPRNGAARIVDGERPVIRLGDGSYRVFARRALNVDGRAVIQISATDITEAYCLAERLRKENEALRRLGERMRSYRENMDELTRREEILSAKIRIHDSIGRTLLRTRYALSEVDQEAFPGRNREEMAEAALDAWEDIANMLRSEQEREMARLPLDYIRETAAAVDLKLVINGPFPADGRAAELFATVASEAMTNAIRHALATEMTIEITETALAYQARFLNNGEPPSGEYEEGGGLGSIRDKLERAGGGTRVTVSPVFCLTVILPKEGTENEKRD